MLDLKKDNFFKKKEFSNFRIKQIIYFLIILGTGIFFVFIVSKILTSEEWNWYWKLSILYFIPPAGKETIIPAGLGLVSQFGLGVPLPPLLWGFSIWLYDVLACLGIITNWWLLELIISIIPAFPFVGIRFKQKPRIYKTKISLKSWYDGLHKKTKEIEAKKYGKLLPFALFVFMFIPFQGTGAMSTTVIGTWLGLRRRETIIIVAFGSFISTLLIILIFQGFLNIFS